MRRTALSLGMGLCVLIGGLESAIAGDLKRDYDFKTPLPQTQRLTIRKSILALPATRLFERCPAHSHVEEFAESTHFLVMVCRDDQDNLKKYWIQKTKQTAKIIRLTARDQPRSEPSNWKNGDDEVYLYKDGLGHLNAYLESYNSKTQQRWAEALLYHYWQFYDHFR